MRLVFILSRVYLISFVFFARLKNANKMCKVIKMMRNYFAFLLVSAFTISSAIGQLPAQRFVVMDRVKVVLGPMSQLMPQPTKNHGTMKDGAKWVEMETNRTIRGFH